MRLEDEKESENVIVHRGGGRGRRVAMGAGGLGIGGVIVVGLLMLIAPDWMKPFIQMFLGGGPSFTEQSGATNDPATSQRGCAGENEACVFVSKVLTSTEDVWGRLFQDGRMATLSNARTYEKPTLNIFNGAIRSGCGEATSAVGPFYCPADRMVYIDPSFFDVMKQQLGASGDFAEAYVIAHEVGHHIQKQIGLADRVQQVRQNAREEESNALSVRMELQADCFAGVWGHYAQVWKNQLSPGDIDEALNAANAIGDDTLQERSRGFAVPHSFTHGSSAQRVAWFKRGFSSGDPAQCNPFTEDMMRTPVSRI